MDNLDTDQMPDWFVALDKKAQQLAEDTQVPVELTQEADLILIMVDGVALQESATQDPEAMDCAIDLLSAFFKAAMAYGENFIEDDDDRESYVPDYGPPGSGAIVTEYQVGTFNEPW